MFGYVYETTNNINGKRYIGKKVSSVFLHEKYLGSGTYLKHAINCYGKENFSVKLLACCESSDELDQMEVMLIEKADAVNNPLYYNLASGIKGNTQGSKKSKEWKQLMSEKATGRHHSTETKNKLSEIVSNTCWVYNEQLDIQYKINQSDLNLWLNRGYRRGRRPLSDKHRKALSEAKQRKYKINSSTTIERIVSTQ